MTAAGPASTPFPTLSVEARRFLEAPRYAVVATLNPDGSVLQAVIWYRLEGDTIVFNSLVGRRWPANIGRDRRISIIVAEGEDYVDLRGEATIDPDPARGQTVIAELARRYEPDAAGTRVDAFAGQRRVTFELHPSRIYERFQGR